MDRITLKAMAKINLGLDVIRRREDGYHEVRMIMQTVDLCDELSFQRLKEDELRLATNLDFLPTDQNNLIIRAAKLLKEEFGIREGLDVNLTKRIPVAAGMAGGSTDAAAVFVAMNELFSLGLSDDDLRKRAVAIGADVPYCITGGTALSEGIGEILTPLPAAPACTVIVAKPPIHVSTAFVYRNLDLSGLERHPDIDGMLECIRRQDLCGVAERLENVLESVTVKKYPIIARIKEFLTSRGALGALMSGSGPTVFALYDDGEKAAWVHKELRKSGLVKESCLTSFADRTCMKTGGKMGVRERNLRV